MTKLFLASGVNWKGNNISSMHYKGEEVWPHKLEPGQAVGLQTPTVGSGVTNQTIETYLNNLSPSTPIGLVKNPEGGNIYVGARNSYNALSLHLVSGYSSNYYTNSALGIGLIEKPTPSEDMMFTVELPGEKSAESAEAYSKDHNLVIQYGKYMAKIAHGENNSSIQTRKYLYRFTFPEVLNKVGRIGNLTMRITGGLIFLYLNATLLKVARCEDVPSDFSDQFIVLAQNMSYTRVGTKPVSGGGPAISSFGFFTGEEASSRGKILYGI